MLIGALSIMVVFLRAPVMSVYVFVNRMEQSCWQSLVIKYCLGKWWCLIIDNYTIQRCVRSDFGIMQEIKKILWSFGRKLCATPQGAVSLLGGVVMYPRTSSTQACRAKASGPVLWIGRRWGLQHCPLGGTLLLSIKNKYLIFPR